MQKLSKKILILVLLSIPIQAEEHKPTYEPFVTKGGKWRLIGYSTEDAINGDDPICIKLFKEFEKYNHLKNAGAENCINNVLDNIDEFKDPPWSEFEAMTSYKNKKLLFELAKMSIQGHELYFTGKAPSHYQKRLNPDYLIADQYAWWLGKEAQFQFWDVEFDMPPRWDDEPQDKGIPTYKTTLLRLSFPIKNYDNLCAEYPKRRDHNSTFFYYFVDKDRTKPIKPRKNLLLYPTNSTFGGRLLLFRNYLFNASLGEIGNMMIPSSVGHLLTKDSKENRFYCNIQFEEEI